MLDADRRVEDPCPDGSGDDKGQRHRIKKDRAKEIFGPDLLIDQDREEHADCASGGYERDAIDEQIEIGDVPHSGLEKTRIILKPTNE